MKARTTAEWIGVFEPAAIPCGPINSIEEVFADPQVKARGLQVSLSRPDGVQTPSVANPIRLSATPVAYEKAAPALGEGTEAVLTGLLGLAPQELEKLKASGAIG
jgi:crotonobetainyl-CoA:carnitine CoA-transferase CaiB-like acyl-CoA transferase